MSKSSSSSSKLPSLSKNFQTSFEMSASDFATSLPVVSRSFGDVFGVSSYSFSRSDLRTPPEERERIRNERLEDAAARRPRKQMIRDQFEPPTIEQLQAEKAALTASSPKPTGTGGRKPSRQQSINSLLFAKHKLSVLEDTGGFDRNKYIGDDAKRDLQQLYRKANRDLSVYVKDEDVPEGRRTPRSLYLREVERRNLPPLSLVLRKEDQSHGVFLANRGLGDVHMAPLVEIIDSLPNVSTVDLNDNRLTDVTLMPLMIKLVSMPSLTHLDLSYNKIDDSSEVIMTYIKSPNCTLETLVLNGADVDDTEAGNLAEAISHNTSISTLCLSHNLLGQAEMAASTNNSIVTGGVAIGLMLEVNTTITKLDLSWNAIRLESAEKFANSLKNNGTLRNLLLGHNSLGDSATQIIGRALKTNTSIEVLDLSYNTLNPKSIAVLANSLVFNETMSVVNLDGNILGRVGTQAMVSTIQRASGGGTRKLHVSFNECDCRKDEPGLFDPSNPTGEYEVDLSTAYGVMVMDECFYLGNYRAGVTLSNLEYRSADHGSGGGFHPVKLALAQVRTTGGGGGHLDKFSPDEFRKSCRALAGLILEGERREPEAAAGLSALMQTFSFDMAHQAALPIVRIIRTQWEAKQEKTRAVQGQCSEELYEVLLFEIFFALFVANDDDLSGTIDADEFVQTLASLGMTITKEAATRLMSEFDKDKSGSIDATEFSAILVKEYCSTETPRGHYVEAATGRPWPIPQSGRAKIKIDCVCDAPSVFDVGDDSGVESIIRAMQEAKTEEQKELIFEQAVQSPYHFMTEVQGQMLLDELAGPKHDRNAKNKKLFAIIASILPQLVSAEHCAKFIQHNLDAEETLSLRLLMGQMFCALTGSPTGHYSFELKRPAHAQFARKLAAIANTETKFCRSLGCNTSQHGDYSHFRNERLDGNNSRISPAWIASCPPTGKLTLDFVSTTRPKQGKQGLPPSRFEKLLNKLELDAIAVRQEELHRAWLQDERVRREQEHARQRQAELEAEQEMLANPDKFKSKRPGISRVPSSNSLTRSGTGNVTVNPTGGTRTVATLSPMSSSMNLYEDPQMPAGTMNMSLRFSGVGTTGSPSKPPSGHGFHSGSAHGGGGSGGGGGGGLSSADTRVNSRGDSGRQTPVINWATPVNSTKPISITANVDALVAEDIVEPMHITQIRESYTEVMDSCHLHLDVYPPERPREAANVDDAGVMHTPREFKLADKPDKYNFPSIYPFAYRKLLELQVQMVGLTLTAEQAAQLVAYFPPVAFLRVSVFLTLFGSIVDFDHMPLIIDGVLDDNERLEVIHRLGVLNIYDSMSPNRAYRLDLRRWDHREFTKILIQLAMVEPGDNWINQMYRWSRYDDHVAGWELPQTWTSPDDGGIGGPRTFGWLQLTYSSTGPGCQPNNNCRRALRKRLLAGLKPLF